MGFERGEKPDNLAELVVLDMEQRAAQAGTSLADLLKRSLVTQQEIIIAEPEDPFV